MFHSWRVILSREFSQIWYLACTNLEVESNHMQGIRCPIRISVDLRFYPKLISHNFCYLIGRIGIGILPMCGMMFWHLLIRFHMSLLYTVSKKHNIGHGLLATNLLSKIHRLIGWSLILKTDLHLSLLESHSLMILLCRMWKDKLSCPSIVSIHWRRSCRWLVISWHCWVDIPLLSHKPLLSRQWICRWVCNWNVGIGKYPIIGLAVVVVEYWGFWVIGKTGGADVIGPFPAKSVTWDVLELFAKNSRGIPYPRQLGGTW